MYVRHILKRYMHAIHRIKRTRLFHQNENTFLFRSVFLSSVLRLKVFTSLVGTFWPERYLSTKMSPVTKSSKFGAFPNAFRNAVATEFMFPWSQQELYVPYGIYKYPFISLQLNNLNRILFWESIIWLISIILGCCNFSYSWEQLQSSSSGPAELGCSQAGSLGKSLRLWVCWSLGHIASFCIWHSPAVVTST